jgi:LGFP repeat
MSPAPNLRPVAKERATIRLPARFRIPKVIELAWMSGARTAIAEKAAAEAGHLGQPAGQPPFTQYGVGIKQAFEHGWVTWQRTRGALAVYGEIGRRWDEIGATQGIFGWPTTDELACPRGPGRYNHFERGSIYWSPTTGAHLVYGAIRDLWASLGWEQGALGLPTSDEQDVPGAPGARRSVFEGGEITWSPASGARVTKLFLPEGSKIGGGLTIKTVGNGGTAVAAPAVSRHVIVTASIDMTDDETFGSNEHGHAERRDERWIDSWDPQGVMTLIGKAGGEMRVELVATASCRPDGSIVAEVDVKLFEGTSEETRDLDGHHTSRHVVQPGGFVTVPFRINNDDEGGDFANISLVISNSDT